MKIPLDWISCRRIHTRRISWNGRPIKDVGSFFTPPHTAYTAQTPRLFSATLRDNILRVHLQDNQQARRLLPDGTYEWVRPRSGEPELNSQAWLIEHRGMWHREE